MIIIYDKWTRHEKNPARVCSGHTLAACARKYWKTRYVLMWRLRDAGNELSGRIWNIQKRKSETVQII
jgi:hypothetical protein